MNATVVLTSGSGEICNASKSQFMVFSESDDEHVGVKGNDKKTSGIEADSTLASTPNELGSIQSI